MTDHPDHPRLRTVAEARFTCQRTGFCCRFHQLGPVEPDCLQALINSDPPSWWPPAAARPWTRVVMGPRGLVTELARVDGHCIFLGDDQRCAVYTHLGGDARPGFCRLFPFHVVQHADGVSVTIRESCAGRRVAQHDGLPVASQAAAAVALARAGGVVRRVPDTPVRVLPGWTVPATTWQQWTDRLVAKLVVQAGAGGTPAGNIPAGGDAGRLVARVREQLAAWADLTLPPPNPARGTLALRAVLAALDLTLQQVVATGGAPSSAESAFVSDHHATIRAAAAALARGEHAPSPPGAGPYLSRQLADLLLGHQLDSHGDIAAGLGRFLALATVATYAAGPSTDLAADPPGPRDSPMGRLSRAYSQLARLSQHRALRAVLARATPALHDAFLHAGA